MDHPIKILFTGDIFIKQDVKNFLSENFKNIVKEHDIAVCDFEAAIETPDAKPFPKAGPYLCQHPRAAEIVIEEGFKVISLANNHIYDYGQKALNNTLNAFANENTIGAGKNFEETYKPLFIEIKGCKTGFLSLCENEFGALTDPSDNRGGYAWINHPSVNTLITKTRQQCDILFVLTHAGIEQIDIPLPEWRNRYKELIDCGAHAVIGCHVHVPQGWETYKGKPIFYSMGNFFFDMDVKHPLWHKGYAVSISVKNNSISNFNIIPTENKDGQVIVNDDPLYNEHLNHLCSILTEPGYSQMANNICKELWENRYKKYYIEAMGWTYFKFTWKDILAVIKNKLQGKDFPLRPTYSFDQSMILHNIRVESHRWAVQRALSQQERNK